MIRTATAGVAMVAALAVANQAAAKIPPPYKNCMQLDDRYPHGVGKVGARDHVTSGDPVTTFKRSNQLYALAMSHNRGLDRDHDGIACEEA